jgi:hypothetical protein
MSVWSQSFTFTFTKNVGRCFILCSTPPTQWTDSPIRWRCLLRVLRPVRRPVSVLDCVLLKDRNLALAPSQGPEINSQACLWVSPSPRRRTQCWLNNQRLIFLRKSCLETHKAGSGPTKFTAEPSLASWSAISFPRTPACPVTQYSPTVCLRLIDPYTDKIKHTYIRSWTVRKIMNRGTKSDLLRFHVLHLFHAICHPCDAHVRPWAYSQATPYGGECSIQSTKNLWMICMKAVRVFTA